MLNAGLVFEKMNIPKLIQFICVVAGGALQGITAEIPPIVRPPYYMVHYNGATNEGALKLGVTYTLWLPPGVKTLHGVIVHQHGCGQGACRDGATAACDLHWQAIAGKQGCALLGPSYEQFNKDDCAGWADPRNGSETRFLQALADLAKQSHHPELEMVPWALWGHSGGAGWVGRMFLLHPDRTAAVWLRSGAPIQSTEAIPAAALAVPVMCNLGTQEGVTVKTNRFAFMWGVVQSFFKEFRAKGGLIGVAVDPNSSHDCGNSRYLAIPWFDACLTARLPKSGFKLKPMPTDGAWLAPLLGKKAQPVAEFSGDAKTAVWLPNERIAKAWVEYVKDGNVSDTTPPLAPTDVRVGSTGELSWEAEADLESGIAAFIIERDGVKLARVPEKHSGYFVGRPVLQQIDYSDTPTAPLAEMRYKGDAPRQGTKHTYAVHTVNSVGLESKPSPAVEATGSSEDHRGSNALPYEIIYKNWPKVPD